MLITLLKLNFKKIFAMHVAKALREVIAKKCDGCEVRPPKSAGSYMSEF